MNEMTAAKLGDNLPPIDANPLEDRLRKDHEKLLERVEELVAGVERVPETLDDDATAQKVIDFTSQIKKTAKKVETARKEEKEDFLEKGRTVDGFFKPVRSRLDACAQTLERMVTVWQRKKAEEERKAREEEARKTREAEEAARKAAEEAAAAAKDEAELEAAIKAEEEAKMARKQAAKAQTKAAASDKDLGRQRGAHATASFRTSWEVTAINYAELDLNAIGEFIPQDAKERAVKAAVRSGARQIRGAVIEEVQKTVVT